MPSCFTIISSLHGTYNNNNFAFTAEEYFTKRSLRDVKDLKESNPDIALVLNGNEDSTFQSISTMSYTEVHVKKVKVGSLILVRAGEVRLLYEKTRFYMPF